MNLCWDSNIEEKMCKHSKSKFVIIINLFYGFSSMLLKGNAMQFHFWIFQSISFYFTCIILLDRFISDSNVPNSKRNILIYLFIELINVRKRMLTRLINQLRVFSFVQFTLQFFLPNFMNTGQFLDFYIGVKDFDWPKLTAKRLRARIHTIQACMYIVQRITNVLHVTCMDCTIIDRDR